MQVTTVFPRFLDALPPRFNRTRLTRLALLAMLAIMLPACKVVIAVPFGGKVITEDGFECQSGETCVVDVSDSTFDSTFTAVPAKGYTFTRWRRKPAAFCVNSSAPCYLSTTAFGPYPALMDLLASDNRFFLEPVFVHYDLAYWKKVLKEIDNGSFTGSGLLYAVQPGVANCDPGGLTESAKARALQALNQVRSLHNLPAVIRDGFYDMQVQEASLVQAANNYLNHFPAPGDACYTAAAREGASTSNLSGGNGVGGTDPARNIFGWTNDNNNLSAVMEAGHRRWVLHPELGFMSYGQVQGYAAQKVFGFNMQPANPVPGSLEFVAMPYMSYPYNLVEKGNKPTPWSFSMVAPAGMSSAFNYFPNAVVTVTDDDSGKKLPVQNLHMDSKGYGLANFLSWMVAGWEHDRPYTVRIAGIRMPGGDIRTIEYPVVIDRYNLLDLGHPLESTDRQQEGSMEGRFNSATDKDSYKVSLSSTRNITGQSEFSSQGFFILVYDPNKALVKSSDQPFTHTFALDQYTIVLSLCDENGLCYQGTRTYRVSIMGQ